MITKNEFKTAKGLQEYFQKNYPTQNNFFIKEIYNIGNAQYYESPLFLYSGHSVIMLYLFDGTLSINIYDKDFFIQHIKDGIFRENLDLDKFYYFNFTKPEFINSFVKNIHVQKYSNGSIDNIVFTFKNGQHLHIENSDLVPGTMCSYLSD